MSYSLTRASTWNMLGYLYLIIASFICTPILLHNLTLSVFAQYSLILATLALLSSLDLGLPQAVVRELVQSRDNPSLRRTIWASSSILFIGSGIVFGIITCVIAYFFALPLTYLLLLFGLIVMQNLTSHYATLPQAEGHFGYYNSKTFIVGSANTLVAALLTSRGFGIELVLAAQLFSYLLTLLPLAYFSLKFFPTPWAYRPTLSKCRDLLNFGLRNQVGKLVGQVQSQYSKYLLAATSPIILSGYIIAQGLVQRAVGAIAQLSTALYPRSSQTKNLLKLKIIYSRLQFSLFGIALLGVLIYYVLGQAFLTWWLKSPELVAIVIHVLNILIWYFVLLIPTPLASAILDGRGRPELTSFFAFITTVLEIGLALILYRGLGFMAPVYSATIAVLITTPLLLCQSLRVLQSKS